jgi:hypothetical protein
MANEKEIKSLESRIKTAMKEISSGEKSPVESEIGKLLNHLRTLDEASYMRHKDEYKPISNAYFGLLDRHADDMPSRIVIEPSEAYKKTPEYKKSKIYEFSDEYRRTAEYKKKKAKEDAAALRSHGGRSLIEDFDESGPPTGRMRKEIKPKKLKLPKAAKPKKEKGDRDRTGYTFDGEMYGKGPLVLAIIRAHVKANPKITFDLLKKAFPDELLKGYGIFQTYERAMVISAVRKRFFLKDEQLVTVRDNAGKPVKIAICNQHSFATIVHVIAQAQKLGHKIS